MRIKEIEARLAAIKKEIEERGDAMKAEEIGEGNEGAYRRARRTDRRRREAQRHSGQYRKGRGHCFPYLRAEAG